MKYLLLFVCAIVTSQASAHLCEPPPSPLEEAYSNFSSLHKIEMIQRAETDPKIIERMIVHLNNFAPVPSHRCAADQELMLQKLNEFWTQWQILFDPRPGNQAVHLKPFTVGHSDPNRPFIIFRAQQVDYFEGEEVPVEGGVITFTLEISTGDDEDQPAHWRMRVDNNIQDWE